MRKAGSSIYVICKHPGVLRVRKDKGGSLRSSEKSEIEGGKHDGFLGLDEKKGSMAETKPTERWTGWINA